MKSINNIERVYVDTDIILDVLAKREPFYEFAAHLFSKADRRELEIGVSSLTFANLNYLLSKRFGTQETWKTLLRFKSLVKVLGVDDKIVNLALGSDFKDFEDAIQYYCAIENGFTVILTRNLRDYKPAKIPVMTAEGFVKG